jgi:hypothetical protein
MKRELRAVGVWLLVTLNIAGRAGYCLFSAPTKPDGPFPTALAIQRYVNQLTPKSP